MSRRLPATVYAAAKRLGLVLLVGTGCADKISPNRIATVAVSPDDVLLYVGPAGAQSRQFVAEAFNKDDDPVVGTTFTWSTSAVGVISVSATGFVTALGPGSSYVVANVGETADSAVVVVMNVPVATATMTVDSIGLETGPLGSGTRQLTVQLRDSTGALLTGRSVAWTSTAPAVASVSAGGLVTAVAEGTAYIRATAEGRGDSAIVSVEEVTTLPSGIDVAISDAQWTQAAQNDGGTIPIVRQGRAAVVNVATTANAAIAVPMQFVLRVFTQFGVLTYSDTVSTVVPPAPTTVAEPTVQFLVPSVQLQPGLRWEVERDPRDEMTDDSQFTDKFPRDGHTALAMITPPLLRLRFVPISLTSHGGVTGNVTAGNLEAYLQLVRAFIPHGEIEATVGTPFASSAIFGTAPSGGAPSFWTTVLPQLDAARVADAVNADAHWIGVVAPPAGFSFVQNGGWGYIPANGASFGPATRTFLLVNVGWFTNSSLSRELVVHELGHNLGRAHAPCGGAGGPDPGFPATDGTIGAGAHDTYAWELGLASAAVAVAGSTGDTMGYCSPTWISPYTYGAMVDFRGSVGVALQAPVVRRRVLLVRGHVEGDRARFDQPVVLTAVASPDDATGDWTLEGRDATGNVLFTQRFALARYDHSETLRPFAVAVPVDAATEATLATLHVRGPVSAAEFRLPR